MGLILVWLLEHLHGLGPSDRLRHVTFIEEAHRLLRRSGPVQSTGEFTGGDPRAQAVETFSSLLAEVRSFGEGLVVIEQIPSKLAPEVVKHAATKMAGRQSSAEDRRLMGEDMLIPSDSLEAMARLEPGSFLAFGENTPRPVQIMLPNCSREWRLPRDVSDEDLPQLAVQAATQPGCHLPDHCPAICRNLEVTDRIARQHGDSIHASIGWPDRKVENKVEELVLPLAVKVAGLVSGGDTEAVVYCFLARYAGRLLSTDRWPIRDTEEFSRRLVAIAKEASGRARFGG